MMAGRSVVLMMATLLCFTTFFSCVNGTNPCRMEKRAPRFETKEGTNTKDFVVTCKLNSQVRGIRYRFDISWVLNTFVDAESTTIIDTTVWFSCLSPMELEFFNPQFQNIVKKNIILSLSFKGECKVLMENLVVWAKATDLRVLGFHGKKLSVTRSINLTVGKYFKEISAIDVDNHVENLPGMFTDTRNIFPKMQRIALYHMSISRVPEQWMSTMPRLQYLYLKNNNLTQPPQFPWNNSTLEIFRTLRKTEYSIEQNVRNFGVHVARNIYVRGLDLSYNKIEDLSSHEFRGFLHIIRLEGNGLKSVGPTCFSNLKGIQTIDMHRNKLTSLPKNLFQGLSSLLNIFLGKNNLSFLEHNLFEGLENIKQIHLEHNNLASLPDGLFRSLHSLEVVRLDANKITKIEQNPFLKHSGLR